MNNYRLMDKIEFTNAALIAVDSRSKSFVAFSTSIRTHINGFGICVAFLEIIPWCFGLNWHGILMTNSDNELVSDAYFLFIITHLMG